MPVSHSRFVCHFPSRFSSQTLPDHSHRSAGPSKESWALEHRGSWCFDSKICQPPRSGEHGRGFPGLVQLAWRLACSTGMVIRVSRGFKVPQWETRITVFISRSQLGTVKVIREELINYQIVVVGVLDACSGGRQERRIAWRQYLAALPVETQTADSLGEPAGGATDARTVTVITQSGPHIPWQRAPPATNSPAGHTARQSTRR